MNLSREERLAALLDGTCTEEERQELLALLAEDDDELEVYAAAAAALHQYEEEERAAGVVPIHAPAAGPARSARPRWRPPRWVGLAAAAALALLIGGRLLWTDRAVNGPAGMLALLHNADGPVPAGVEPGTVSTRGPGDPSSLGDQDRVRLGAWLVQLEAEIRADPPRARTAAGEIATLLERVDDRGSVASRFRAFSDGTSQTLDPGLATRAEDISGGPKATRLGEWLQVARIAAAREDQRFFQMGESRRWMAGRNVPPRLKPLAKGGLQRVREAAERHPAPDWPGLRKAVASLYATLTT
jgi:hypothetical protein